jgi:LacI family transcriptional regulator
MYAVFKRHFCQTPKEYRESRGEAMNHLAVND